MKAEEEPTLLGRRFSGVLPTEYVLLGATGLIFVAVWESLSRFVYRDLQLIFPSTLDILGAFVELVSSGSIWPHLLTTVKEASVAFLLAAVVGITIGTVLGINNFLADVFKPLLYYFSTIPKIIIYPVLLIVFGIGIESKIAMGFMAAIFPIVVNTMVGVNSVPEKYVRIARVHRASPFQTFVKVYMAATVGQVLNGLRLGLGVSIVGVLLGEVFVSNSGLGNQMQFYFKNLLIPKMYAVLLLIFLGTLSVNWLLRYGQKKLHERGYRSLADDQEAFGF